MSGFAPHLFLGSDRRRPRYILGWEETGTVSNVMEVFGKTNIEYVVRVGGGVKAQVYYLRYELNGLVFLFQCDVWGELTERPPHPPLPTYEEILTAKIDYVHVLREDSALLGGLRSSVLAEPQ